MRWLILLMFLPAVAWGQMHEILRPTAEMDAPGVTLGTTCGGINALSTPMPNSWDAAGISTSSTQSIATPGHRYATRLFTPWANTSNTYTSLTLNVNSSSTGLGGLPDGSGDAFIAYSTNHGSTWTTIISGSSIGGWAQITSPSVLSPGQVLANLEVGICVDAADGGSFNATIYDIWTDGVYGLPPTPTPLPPAAPAVQQPTVISQKSFWPLWVVWLCGRLW